MKNLSLVLVLGFISAVVCQEVAKVGVLNQAAENVTEAAQTVQNLLEAGDLPEVGAIFVTGFSEPALTIILQELVKELLVSPGIIVEAFVAAISQVYTEETPKAQADFENFMVGVISNITDTEEAFSGTPIASLASITFTGINPILKTLVADSMMEVAMDGCGGVGPLLDAGMLASDSLAQLYNATLAQYPVLFDCYSD
eukprot:TRINITY_DN2867_c1_g1_i3.p4 TRINITY_DN2867_c1_g1~~TRINITY_DN2867_c1_g1_i3.p4  ORF type:complete len:199 (-),score=52.66 TRINITY_DN2867_c1_g1_i3:2125-2721(-)